MVPILIRHVPRESLSQINLPRRKQEKKQGNIDQSILQQTLNNSEELHTKREKIKNEIDSKQGDERSWHHHENPREGGVQGQFSFSFS